MYSHSIASKMKTEENKKKQEERIAEQNEQGRIIEYKRCIGSYSLLVAHTNISQGGTRTSTNKRAITKKSKWDLVLFSS